MIPPTTINVPGDDFPPLLLFLCLYAISVPLRSPSVGDAIIQNNSAFRIPN